MRLVRLSLLNFRQHANTEIEFRPGLTGIIGPNGAGKSTILEAIGWALYGSAAARGTNDTIRFSRAPGRSPVRVELIFELAGHEFRVVRTLNHAEVYLDGGTTPVATTLGGVTEYLQARLGMTRDEFFNTYFTGQKELQFLAQMGPTQRGRFLSQVLGYERLRVAQDLARARRNELRHEIEGLRAGLPDPKALAAEREAAERRREEARRAVREAEEALAAANRRLAEVTPRWEAIQQARERARELDHALELARGEVAAAERDTARIAGELEAIVRAEGELLPLRRELAALPTVAQECEHFAELARLAERRNALAETEVALVRELAGSAERLATLEQAPGLLEQYSKELETLRAELEAAERELEAQRAAWIERRQEVDTRLQTYRDRAQELKEQLRQLREAGPDGVCPTCRRPLREEYERVLTNLEDEWDRLVQDGKWLKQRRQQLETPPAEVAAAEARREELARAVSDRERKRARCEQAVHELAALRAERQEKEARLARLREELAGIPAGYDVARHREAEKRLAELRELERRANRLEQIVEARPARERERDAVARTLEAARTRVAQLEGERRRLEFRDEEAAALRQAYESALEESRRAELRVTEMRGLFQAAEEALDTVLRAEANYQERRDALRALEREFRHHEELDAAFSQLRAELNARVRPELAELASRFLAEITDGRYTALEIDDRYNILVLDEGEEKPVISGGEEDVVNLVLRLAISQMIAERSGHPLSVLILDEVFGSLDLERRDNVIELLHKLEDRYEQVILITHIDTIREGLDRVIRVEFDERTGSSVVREESVRGEPAGVI
ncbi:MAG TPA: SMC family ATPase [Longimicrobiales bacterium]|nr:SMC family ATPase [Longimicrobiales bacterium]